MHMGVVDVFRRVLVHENVDDFWMCDHVVVHVHTAHPHCISPLLSHIAVLTRSVALQSPAASTRAWARIVYMMRDETSYCNELPYLVLCCIDYEVVVANIGAATLLSYQPCLTVARLFVIIIIIIALFQPAARCMPLTPNTDEEVHLLRKRCSPYPRCT